jgi:hypothetical protein
MIMLKLNSPVVAAVEEEQPETENAEEAEEDDEWADPGFM